MQWLFLAVMVVAWWILGRPITDLGFNNLEGLQLWGGAAVLVVLIGMLVYGWQTTKRAGEQEKMKQDHSFAAENITLPVGCHTQRVRHWSGFYHDGLMQRELRYFPKGDQQQWTNMLRE